MIRQPNHDWSQRQGHVTREKQKSHYRAHLLALMTPMLVVAFLCGYLIGRTPIEGNALVKGVSANAVSRQLETANQSADDWQLLLVNRWNELPDGYTVTLIPLKDGHSVDERCYPDLQEMIDACRAEGLQPKICSSYRSQKEQQQLFDNEAESLLAQGYSTEAALEKAGMAIAVPGCSEHQTGLAVDIVDMNSQLLNESQENTAVQQWLMRNSWRYGFVLRYPPGKTDITGIIYEPWHYRYVGKAAAQEMFEQGLCLEEYLARPPLLQRCGSITSIGLFEAGSNSGKGLSWEVSS